MEAPDFRPLPPSMPFGSVRKSKSILSKWSEGLKPSQFLRGIYPHAVRVRGLGARGQGAGEDRFGHALCELDRALRLGQVF